MTAATLFIYVSLAFTALLLAVLVFLTVRIWHKAEQGTALVITTPSGTRVSFNGALVIPVFYTAEVMDISLKTVEIERRGGEGLICRDNIRADVQVSFFVGVTPTEEAVRKAAESYGCQRASDPGEVARLFRGKFTEAMKIVAKSMDFEEAAGSLDEFRDRILLEVGSDLSGFSLEDLVVDEFEQTPIVELDPDNILDRQGIAKIKSMSADGSSQSQNVFEPQKGAKAASSVDVVSPLVGESFNAKREG